MEVVTVVQGAIPQMFGLVKIAMIELFDERYVDVMQAAATAATAIVDAARVRGSFPCRNFSNTKPPDFDGFKDPIVAMRWLSDVKGCFFTCSCPKDQKVRCILNLICLGAKDW